jgi:AraC-like DNA-binding protein
MESKCSNCRIRPKQKHFNSKWCLPCALEFRKKPKSTLTQSELKKAKRLIGKMSREEIAEKLGTSLSNLKRAFRGTRLAYHNYCQANPSLVKKVNKYFETHTQEETAKHFKLSRKQVDHIVYRYRSAKRKQIQWSKEQIIEAAKMAGLVSYKSQAKYFNRPNAFEGSIHSLWIKKFKIGGQTIHGMPHWTAKYLVTNKAKYIRPFGNDRNNNPIKFRRILLWVDMEKCLKKDVPDFLKEGVRTMAQFQRWLFKSQDPKKEILKIMMTREKFDTGYPPVGEKK